MRAIWAWWSRITRTRVAQSRTSARSDALMTETKTLTLCLDVSHIALVGEDPLAHLRKYRERLGYVHLKDWGRGEFTELGQGTLGIDFVACLRELESQQFAGWCVVEHSVSAVSTLHSAQMNAAYLKGARLQDLNKKEREELSHSLSCKKT